MSFQCQNNVFIKKQIYISTSCRICLVFKQLRVRHSDLYLLTAYKAAWGSTYVYRKILWIQTLFEIDYCLVFFDIKLYFLYRTRIRRLVWEWRHAERGEKRETGDILYCKFEKYDPREITPPSRKIHLLLRL